jgi:hypothetical protein
MLYPLSYEGAGADHTGWAIPGCGNLGGRARVDTNERAAGPAPGRRHSSVLVGVDL